MIPSPTKEWLLKKCNNYLVRGSTLIETVVAMVLLIFFALLFYTQLLNFNTTANPTSEFKAFCLASKAVAEIKTGTPLDSMVLFDQGNILKISEMPMPEMPNVYFLKIDVQNQNSVVIYSHKELIPCHEYQIK